MKRSLSRLLLLSLGSVALLASACGVDTAVDDATEAGGAAGDLVADGSIDGGTLIAGEEVIELVRASAERTAQVTSGRLAIRLGVSGAPELPDGFDLRAEGAFDLAAGRQWFSVDLTPLFEATPPDSLGEAAPLLEMLAGEIEVKVIGDESFIRLPLFDGWLRAESSGDAPTGLTLPSLEPDDLLAMLDAISSDGASVVGREQLRDVGTTRIHTTVDIASLMEQLPAEALDLTELGGLSGMTGEITGLELIALDIWIGDDQLVRQIAVSITDPAEAGGSTASELELVVEIYDLGEPVDIQPPPADEIIDQPMLGATPS